MKPRPAQCASLGLVLLLVQPGSARALDVGLETGVSFARATTFGIGLIVDQSFKLETLNVALWADAQTGVGIGETPNTTIATVPLATYSTYYPVNGGLRLGFGDEVQPYLGLVVGGLFHNQNSNPGSVFTIGGDLGADFLVGPFRLGAELRGTSLQNVPTFETSWVVQLLASARYVFF